DGRIVDGDEDPMRARMAGPGAPRLGRSAALVKHTLTSTGGEPCEPQEPGGSRWAWRISLRGERTVPLAGPGQPLDHLRHLGLDLSRHADRGRDDPAASRRGR